MKARFLCLLVVSALFAGTETSCDEQYIEKGRIARRGGAPASANPYHSDGFNGNSTFEGAAWLKGWSEAGLEIPKEEGSMAKKINEIESRIEELERQNASYKQLLNRLLEWDHLDTTGDGEYWRSEIKKSLTPPAGE